MKELLQEASNEIRRLRRANEILSAQVRVIEVFGAAMNSYPESQCASPDICWSISREIERLDAARAETVGEPVANNEAK